MELIGPWEKWRLLKEYSLQIYFLIHCENYKKALFEVMAQYPREMSHYMK